MPKISRRTQWIALAVKYLFSLLITALAGYVCRLWAVLPVGVLELIMILTVSGLALSVSAPLGHALHFLLYLLYNGQMLVLLFGNSFVTAVMLTNLDMISDLQGNFGVYALGVVPLLILLCIPLPAKLAARKRLLAALAVSAVGWGGLMLAGYTYCSPVFSVGTLIRDEIEFRQVMRAADEEGVDPEQYHRAGISDYGAKPASLPEQPNVILIFCEGLSQNVVEDARGLMPNLAALEAKSLRFSGYYNHTFATFRGLIGQLFSGHQLSNYDTNGLISLQSILREAGYRTLFINTEPGMEPFADYLENLGFDAVVTDPDRVVADQYYMSDKDAYALLWETAQRQHDQGGPFFLTIYTFQTHVSMDSEDAVFGDGGSAALNKFYNTDQQLGAFLEAFQGSALAEDTVLVFTADHATYADADFLRAFPENGRVHSEVSDIPFLIYHSGIEPRVIDVNGRNTLDMAPTLLDYLDLSAENYFMGDSLLGGGERSTSAWDTMFFDGTTTAGTADATVDTLAPEVRLRFLRDLAGYFTLSNGSDATIGDVALGKGLRDISIEVSEDHATLTVAFTVERPGAYAVAAWGMADGQNDLQWCNAKRTGADAYEAAFDLAAHAEIGEYSIHIYQMVKDQMEPVLFTTTFIQDYPGYVPAAQRDGRRGRPGSTPIKNIWKQGIFPYRLPFMRLFTIAQRIH